MLLLAGQKDKYENRLILASDKDKLFEAEHNLSKFVYIRKNSTSTIDLLVSTSSDQLVIVLKIYISFLQNNLCYQGGQLY